MRVEPKLEIPVGTFSRTAVLHLVNESIVPALVEEFLRSNSISCNVALGDPGTG